MTVGADDRCWMGAALVLAERGRGATWPNPNVGCVIVAEGRVVGRGWTQPGGRPHAEAMALNQAGAAARRATLYTTLEPCAHVSERGPACSDLIVDAGIARVVAALGDTDPRTDGEGFVCLRAGSIDVMVDVRAGDAERSMAGFLSRRCHGRPHVTLKLALSLDGAAAMSDGRSQWITGPVARAHGHLERARADAVLVGRGTWDADNPKLDVRLPGLEARSPAIFVLSSAGGAEQTLLSPADTGQLDADWLLIEGGLTTAASFLRNDLVDRLLLYRAPVFIGGGQTLGDLGLRDLADAHARWSHIDSRRLGSDTLDVYERIRG